MKEVDVDAEVIPAILAPQDPLVDPVKRDTLVCKVAKVIVAYQEKLAISVNLVQLANLVPQDLLVSLDL